MRDVRWILTVSACLAASAAQARAQHTVDPVTTTDVSGFRSTEVTWLAAGRGVVGLYAIAWSEDGDKPCAIGVGERALSGGGGSAAGGSINLCGYPDFAWFGLSSLSNSTRTVSFEGNARYFIRGVAVCNNNKNNRRLKGVRIYAAKVWATQERVDALTRTEEDDQPNCATWDRPVYCPSNHVASAVVVHHNDREITGLALRCRRVEY